MKLKVIMSLLTLFCTSVFAQGTMSKGIGNFKSFNLNGDVLEFTTENAQIIVSAFSDNIVRVRMTKDNFRIDHSYAVIQNKGNFLVKESENQKEFLFSTKNLKVKINKNPFLISFYDKSGNLLNSDYDKLGTRWQGTEVNCYKTLSKNERFIGLGEKTGNLDRRGNEYTNWNTDHYAYETDADPLYVSIPFFIGINEKNTYGIFFDNSHKSKFNFAASTDDQYYFFGAEDGEMNYYFIGSGSVKNIIEDYTWLTGRMKMPPYWSLGYQQCRWSYYPDKEVIRIARTLREKDFPGDVIYLDIDYMDQYKIFTWNPKHFPDPKKTIDELKSMGFHVVTIVDPGIKIDENYSKYTEGVKNDYFAKYPDGSFYTGTVWPGRCHFPDFTNAKVREWWGKSFTALTDMGVEGFWNDMNEPAAWGQAVPTLIEFNNGEYKTTLREARNIYGMQMSRGTFEGTKNIMNNQRPFILTRAAYAGIQRYSAVWTGDNFASDDHMFAGVRLVNSLGLSGVSFVGPDAGGFSKDPSPDLFVRWLSVGAYTPFFRNHTEINSRQQEPWVFGDNHTNASREIIKQRYRLLPYIYSAFYQAAKTGIPIARSLAIDYTFDNTIYDTRFQNQYMFGDNLLIAPASSTERIIKVYLPEGEWYRLSTDEFYTGGKEIFADCPITDLPVFVKAGSVITCQSDILHTGVKPGGILLLHIYKGKNNSSTIYYEDDRNSYDYENGSYYIRNINLSNNSGTVKISKTEGSYKSVFNKIQIVLHGYKNVKEINVNGAKTEVEPSGKNLYKSVFLLTDSEINIEIKQDK